MWPARSVSSRSCPITKKKKKKTEKRVIDTKTAKSKDDKQKGRKNQ